MAYIDYEYYTELYNYELSEQDFNRLVWDACRRVDIVTTGLDGIKRLKVAFPTDEDDAESVKRCVAKLVYTNYLIEQAEERANKSRSYIEREDGTLVGKIVTSVSSGSESISYGSGSNTSLANATMIDAVLSDRKAQDNLYRDIIRECLSGICDANGVSLLYMGC